MASEPASARRRDTKPPDIAPEGVATTTADSLGKRLGELAKELAPRDAQLLAAVVVMSMSPLERMRFLDPSGLLDAHELDVLGGLPPPKV